MSSSDNKAPAGPTETAQYIAKASRELREMAASSGLEFIAYLLAMAEEESIKTAQDGAPASGKRGRSPRAV